ncbi:MAG: hypothetical protein NTV05_17425 [Acidobacteria bacterium]|nr:hypothetical protein [Acidobacteriota bacterium]
MRLATSRQIDGGELAPDRERDRWNVDLRKVNIDLAAAVRARRDSPIDDRQVQLRRQETVDTTLGGPGVHKCQNPADSGNWHSALLRSIVRIKPNINRYGGSVGDKQVCTGSAALNVWETALNVRHAREERIQRTPEA